jgi:hypothetical protein
VEEIKKIYLEKAPVLFRVVGMAAAEMKDELNLEIQEDGLISLTEWASPEKKVDKPGEDSSRRCSQAGVGVVSILIFLHEVTGPRA